MASTPLILNEWIIHDLRGDNGVKRRIETFQFLQQIEVKCDHIVLLRGSPWMRKAYKLMKDSNPSHRLISKYIQSTFIINPLKHHTYEPDEVPELSSELQEIVPDKDAYLIKLAKIDPKSIIITTDGSLLESISAFKDIQISLREDFIASYM